jgi:Uma2 family endonuclease
LYQERRVPVYWIVDGDEGLVEVWTPDLEFPIVERERVTWQPAGAGRALVLDLRELFRPI